MAGRQQIPIIKNHKFESGYTKFKGKERKKIYIFIVQRFCATAYNIHIKKNIFLMTV